MRHRRPEKKRGSVINAQRGIVFIVSLVMLVLLTLIAVSAIQTTTGMLQIVGNAQFRTEAIGAATQAIDQLVGSIDEQVGLRTRAEAMNNAGVTVDVTGDGQGDYRVSFTPLPVCLSRADAGASIDRVMEVQRSITNANLSQDTPAKAAAFNAAQQRLAQLATCTAGAGQPPQCFWSLWRVRAEVKDPYTGVSLAVTQGTRVLIGGDDQGCG
jgi:hypothetical protein